MVSNKGFYFVHRTIYGLFYVNKARDFIARSVYIFLAGAAEWRKDAKLKPGELQMSLDHISDHTGITKMGIRTFLMRFEELDLIAITPRKSSKSPCTILVKNYHTQSNTVDHTQNHTAKCLELEEQIVDPHTVNHTVNHTQSNTLLINKINKEIHTVHLETNLDFLTLWNFGIQGRCPQIKKLNPRRNKAIKAFLKDYTIDDWKKIIAAINASTWHRGDDTTWCADFDWAIGNGREKMLEREVVQKVERKML